MPKAADSPPKKDSGRVHGGGWRVTNSQALTKPNNPFHSHCQSIRSAPPAGTSPSQRKLTHSASTGNRFLRKDRSFTPKPARSKSHGNLQLPCNQAQCREQPGRAIARRRRKKRKHSMNGTNLVRGLGEREETSAARGVHRLELAVFRAPGIWRPRRSIGFGGGGGVEAARLRPRGRGKRYC
jgi:hypothetical protein